MNVQDKLRAGVTKIYFWDKSLINKFLVLEVKYKNILKIDCM